VHWLVAADFAAEFPMQPMVADQRFVDEGDRITCAGGGAAADLATYLVERHLGRALARKSRQALIFDDPRAAPEAQPHPPMASVVTDIRVQRALLLMEEHLSTPLPIAVIAARLALSPRQLGRIFEAALGASPIETYRRLRLRYARWLLEKTDRTVTDIALEAGFADCAHFSRSFKVAHGRNPSAGRAIRATPLAHLASHRVFD
jgi:transcriptional regulator GlxA family with amidase domain